MPKDGHKKLKTCHKLHLKMDIKNTKKLCKLMKNKYEVINLLY